MNEFFQRLKQRKLVQWAIAYVAAAFALLQGIDIVAQQFGWPEGVRRGITLALNRWLFCYFSFGLVSRGARRAERYRHRANHHRISLGVRGRIALAVRGYCARLLRTYSRSPCLTKKQHAPAVTIPDKSIAVLPFENLSEDKANGYFAAGIQDEILTGLAKIGELKVISRTSTQQ